MSLIKELVNIEKTQGVAVTQSLVERYGGSHMPHERHSSFDSLYVYILLMRLIESIDQNLFRSRST